MSQGDGSFDNFQPKEPSHYFKFLQRLFSNPHANPEKYMNSKYPLLRYVYLPISLGIGMVITSFIIINKII